MIGSFRRVSTLPFFFTSLLLGPTSARAGDAIEYNRDIRPILSENCFACHGPDSAARKAGLRLDQRDAAIKKQAFVPGKPEQSELVKRLTPENPKELMPPAKTNKKLNPAQKDLLRRWIASGATYQPHWSLIAPVRPTPPAVANKSWVRNPIDAFVLARLEHEKLQPASEADRHTLARRLSLDLTGLPPMPAEVKAFVDDKSPDAYEKYVDRLMASPQWGEHRGRYWLDAARYADTHGIHFDNYREMWSYRDWVINAFNKNMKFDQFTTEQLAGDLLPKHTLEQEIASGFNRCNITSNEGGLIPEEYLVLYTRDRTETTSQVWLGLTAGCAVCHDHKFDPISQKEFYSLAAFFNNTTQGAMDGNIKDTPPTVFVPTLEDRPRHEALVKEIPAARKAVEDRKQAARATFDKWLADSGTKLGNTPPAQPDGLKVHATLSEGEGAAVTFVVDGKPKSVPVPNAAWDAGQVANKALKVPAGAVVEVAEAGDFEKDQAFSFAVWLKIPKDDMTGAVLARMDDQHDFRGWDLWLQNNRIGTHIINRWPNDALKVVTRDPLPTGKWTHVCISYNGSAKAAGVTIHINGEARPTNIEADSLAQTVRTQVPLKLSQRHTSSRLEGLGLQDFRIYAKTLAIEAIRHISGEARLKYLTDKPIAARTPAEKEELFTWWLPTQDRPYVEALGKVNKLEGEENAIKSRGTMAHVMHERSEAAMAFVLFRGDYDKRRDSVKPETPKALPPMPADLPRNRLGFAQWLLRPEHPLTARVTVNRFWQEIFGTGLVRTAGDFGVTGEMPSHPELLDWLAVDFRESGWDIKRFYRQLVTSSTYRQSAQVTPEKAEKDPANRLLSRGPRFRMDAEMIRDYALASTGMLVRTIGGKSVRPYQPDGVWEAVAMIGSDTRDYKRDNGDALYRRSMYTLWKRAAPPASMDILNAPNRETCAVRRERTDTPLQALVTLNDPQFVEAARHLAETTLKQGGANDDAKLGFLAERLLCRPFRAEELAVVRNSLGDLVKHYASRGEEAKKLITVGESKPDAALPAPTLAAWTLLVNELLNLDEVLNK